MRICRTRPGTSGAVALTVGNFDGVHRGHRALLSHLAAAAAKRGLGVGVVTFEPHPLEFFFPKEKRPRLSSLREKTAKLAAAGVECVYLRRFNSAFAAMPAADFAAYLFADLRARYVLVGDDFRFGHKRGGDFALLQKIAGEYGAQAEKMPTIAQQDGRRLSSNFARRLLANGDFAAAADALGAPWQISGRVVRGGGLGKKLGFPTANLNIRHTPPCVGIFAAKVKIGDDESGGGGRKGNIYKAALSIGVRPTIAAAADLCVEAHLLDFSGDLYGRRLQIEPAQKLRDEEKYPDMQTLSAAIAADVKRAAAILEASG